MSGDTSRPHFHLFTDIFEAQELFLEPCDLATPPNGKPQPRRSLGIFGFPFWPFSPTNDPNPGSPTNGCGALLEFVRNSTEGRAFHRRAR